jgi:PIN domain nuclease of toxin-antitoxin system
VRLLLDTHVFAWWLINDPALSDTARKHIADPQNDIYVSAVTAFEMAIKHRIGKWPEVEALLPVFDEELRARNFMPLPVSIAHGIKAGQLVAEHRDPFDRLLAAQAVVEDIPIVTQDMQVQVLGATVIW